MVEERAGAGAPALTAAGADAVLLDIDGTLAVGSSDHLASLSAVARTELGIDAAVAVVDERPVLGDLDVTGWIDAQVVRLLLHRAGRDPGDPHGLRHVLAAYAEHYAQALASGRADAGRLVPGVEPWLRDLAARGVPLGLVTGNAHEVARAKLFALGVGEYFRYSPRAGFGDHAPDRRALVPAALQALGVAAGADVLLVGDTAADMAAARAAGVTAVGVLTGGDDRGALAGAGAGLVVGSVPDIP